MAKRFIAVSGIGAVLTCSAGFCGEFMWEQHNQAAMRAYKRGNDAEAVRLFRLAAKEAETLPPDDLRLAKTLGNLATALLNQGKNSEAEAELRRSLQLLEKSLGKEHPTVANTLNDLGVLYYQQYKYQDAEACYKRVLGMDAKNLPPDHELRRTSLDNYVKLLRRQGRFKEADKIEPKATSPSYRRSQSN